ncbi:MAG: M12 family metallo-peptidase [Flavobacteriaceae bacterium]|nr:M12 family metallo-peptidase [Flavobacteriaceae bacterium]
MKKLLCYSLLCLFTVSAFAQKTWKQTTISAEQKEILTERKIPLKSQVFLFDINTFKNQLNTAPQRGKYHGKSNVIIQIPNSNGDLVSYRVEEASVFATELQEKYPNIRAYAGHAVDDASTYLRFTVSPYNGINGIVLKGNRSESEVIEVVPGDTSKALIFKRSDRKNNKEPFECTTDEELSISMDKIDYSNRAADDSILRTFDLAMSVTGEYSAFHGGTLPLVNAAIATTIARNNAIFEIDFAVTLVLIATNDNVVYLNGAMDPYNSTSDASYNSALQSTLTSQIGEANYDVGHLMAGIGNNGNAGCIGCICVDGQKGSGYTTSTSPIGDAFDVDFVAHEFGHQFGGRHTFTHSSEGAGIAQMEPGSGSTIMSYAGITGATDVQSNVGPYFHAISIQQITAHAKTRTCDVETVTGNNIPVVNAGTNLTLPVGTPFRLIGSATDTDGADVLTYCWEQYNEEDAANAYPSETSASNNRPLFRSYNPTTSAERTFPEMEDLLANGVNGNVWEKIPTVGRTADFRLTVRDNRSGGAGNSFDDMLVTWDATRGPLEVTSQSVASLVWTPSTSETITWNVNDTDLMTGAANVDILLSLDGGMTYPTTLATGIINDGSEPITVPNVESAYCRIMIQPTGAPFFAINTIDFAIGNYTYIAQDICIDYVFNTGIAVVENAGSYTGYSLNVQDSETIKDVAKSVQSKATSKYLGIESSFFTIIKF